ncbi:MAG: hypothetical protein GY765_01080 [bacterium]|nr:hypothetical protein [bacterium]
MDNQECFEGCNSGYRVLTGERGNNGPESSMPPLPDPISVSAIQNTMAANQWRDASQTPDFQQSNNNPGITARFSEGCYFVRIMPISLHTPSKYQYEGTLRFQQNNGTFTVSGDLYTRDFCKTPTYCPSLSGGEEGTHIPIFPRVQYAYYLRAVRFLVNPDSDTVSLTLEPYRFHRSNNSWSKRDNLSAELRLAVGTGGVQYWKGDIRTDSNVTLGTTMLVRISSSLRQGVIEIDNARGCKPPLADEQGTRWREVFKRAGWDVAINTQCRDNIEEPEDKSWSTAELHARMLEHREKVNLDEQWHYHILAVSRFDDRAFGVMYDNTVSGIDDIPREGAAVAYGEVFNDKEEFWGECKGKVFGESGAPYLRTSIHEIGHAMMLYHPDNTYENYIMQKTVHVARNAVPPRRFPGNINWNFSPGDVNLLCHLPDIAIRPGGVSFGTPHSRLPVNVRDEIIEAQGLALEVSPLLKVVPFGAPVRVNLSLVNTTNKQEKCVPGSSKRKPGSSKWVPGSLSMKTGHLSGRVISPSGTSHSFATIIRYTRDFRLQLLEAGVRLNHSVTLLWGTQGPLFPTSGYYRVVLELRWDQDGVEVRAGGSTSLMVRDPIDDAQAEAALCVFSNPNSLLALAIGGDHVKDKYEAFGDALTHKELKSHYALVEAKRLGQFFKKRRPDLVATAKIVKNDTVMSRAEILRLTKILVSFKESDSTGTIEDKEKEALRKLAAILLKKLNKQLSASDEDRKIKDSRCKLEELVK